MSDEQDASIGSDQDQLDGQLSDEDAGGLFGSGSEDEQSGYKNPLQYNASKITLLISGPTVLVTNVANLTTPT